MGNNNFTIPMNGADKAANAAAAAAKTSVANNAAAAAATTGAKAAAAAGAAKGVAVAGAAAVGAAGLGAAAVVGADTLLDNESTNVAEVNDLPEVIEDAPEAAAEPLAEATEKAPTAPAKADAHTDNAPAAAQPAAAPEVAEVTPETPEPDIIEEPTPETGEPVLESPQMADVTEPAVTDVPEVASADLSDIATDLPDVDSDLLTSDLTDDVMLLDENDVETPGYYFNPTNIEVRNIDGNLEASVEASLPTGEHVYLIDSDNDGSFDRVYDLNGNVLAEGSDLASTTVDDAKAILMDKGVDVDGIDAQMAHASMGDNDESVGDHDNLASSDSADDFDDLGDIDDFGDL